MSRKHADNMDRFYSRKWQGHSGYWFGIYPPSAQVYAFSVVKGRNDVIQAAMPDQHLNILDIGCGVGDLMALLGQKARHLVGVDIAETNVRMTRANLLNDGTTNTSVLLGSAEELPFVQDHFDTIVIADVIEHVEQVGTALGECARVLRPGGLLICTTPHSSFQIFLQRADSVMRVPIKFLRLVTGKRYRSQTRPNDSAPYERFLSTRALHSAFLRNGLSPLIYRRICFYPGPEGGGLFGYLMLKLYNWLGPNQFNTLTRSLLSVFKQIERIQLLNQKQLWICQKSRPS